MTITENHPLLLQNLSAKAQTSNAEWMRATVSVVDGYGNKGAKPRPFRQDQAVKQFQSWVHRAGMLNAMAFAATPLRLYVKKRKSALKHYGTAPVPSRRRKYLAGESSVRPSQSVIGKTAAMGGDFEEVTEPHPVTQVLSSANPFQNGFELSTLRALYWQITGNAYIHPVMSATLGRPTDLYLLPSQWVQIIPSRTEFISGYVYGRKPEQIEFAPDEVIQWKLPSLTDQYYGMGWVEALWTALGLHNAKRTMDTAKMDNFARPDWMLVVKSGATKETLDRLETVIESKLQGSKNSGRFLSVTGDVEAVPLNFDVVELGDPDKVIEEIAAVSGVPLQKLRGNDPVKANSETQDLGWLRDTILPYCRLDEEQLNARYIPLFEELQDGEAFLAYDNPVPDNEAAQVDLFVKQVGGPYKTVNEAREADGLLPIEGGDVLRQPTQPNPDAGIDTVPKPEKRFKSHINGAPGQPARQLPHGGPITRIMQKVFAEQRAACLGQIEKSVKAKPENLPVAFIPLDKWTPEIAKQSQPVIELMMQDAGRKLLTQVGASHEVFSVFEKNIPKAAQELTLKFAESTNETTSMKLEDALKAARQAISDGLTEGDTRIKLRDRVNEIFDEADSSRAETIARTEASRAAHNGELMSAKESKVVSGKYWMASADACDICEEFAAQGVIGLDESFGDSDYGPIEGAPGHPRCQCSMGYSVKDDRT